MNALRSIFDRVGNGINTALECGASVLQQSLNSETNESLRPHVEMGASTKTLTNFVKFVGLVDMDPIAWDGCDNSIKDKLRKIRDRAVHCTVQTAEAMSSSRAQVNPMADIIVGKDTMTYLCAPPQYGKTVTMMFSMWRAAIEHEIVSIMFTLARDGENKRIRSSMQKFNTMITTCAQVFGLDLALVPLMAMHDSHVKGDDARFGAACRRGVSKEIPFYVLMGNNSGVKKAKALVEDHMSLHVGRDVPDVVEHGVAVNNGRMLAQVVVDEADNFIQPGRIVRVTRGNGTSYRAHEAGALETALNTEVSLWKEIPTMGHPSLIITAGKVQKIKGSLFDCFTSILLVTATIHAFLTTEKPIATRTNQNVVSAVPSDNYWGAMKMDGCGCKVVENMEVASYPPMLDDMVAGASPRHGLVAITSKATGTQLKTSQDLMALGEANRVPGVMSIAWNGDGIVIYSSSPGWSDCLLQTGAFDASRVNNGVSRFASKKANLKKKEWDTQRGEIDNKTNKPTGGPIPENIHTYPGLIDFIYSVKGFGTPVPHTILFSLNMAARGTPIKGWSHCGELTDMFIDTGGKGHDEYLIQLAGRILGIDKRTQAQRKIIWGPRVTLEKLYDAVISLPFFIAKLKEGVLFPDIIREATRGIYEATGVYKDVGQATTKRTDKRTREGNEVNVVREYKALKAAEASTGNRIERVEWENRYQDVPIRQHITGARAEPVATVVSAVSAPPSPSTNPTPEQAWNNQRLSISRAMENVVRSSEVPVSVVIMADRVEGECHFANSNGFTMEEFVDTVCLRPDVLLSTGLKFENGIFSVNTVSNDQA